MDPKLVALIALRSASTLFALQGRSEVAEAINVALTAYHAGRNIDEHMRRIADTLEAGGTLSDWEDITARINSEVDEFLQT